MHYKGNGEYHICTSAGPSILCLVEAPLAAITAAKCLYIHTYTYISDVARTIYLDLSSLQTHCGSVMLQNFREMPRPVLPHLSDVVWVLS